MRDFKAYFSWSLLIRNKPIKVGGSSMLIHAFAYSLFVGIYLFISNMTGYSLSCHSIKIIYWGTPERDVLSDNMVLIVSGDSYFFIYFMLCHISFVYKDNWWFHEGKSIIFCMENTEKILLFLLYTNSSLN